MEKVRYMISDAAAMAGVETHVLRYWEEELDLTIPRNEMGHRYYTRENILEFIKELKILPYIKSLIFIYQFFQLCNICRCQFFSCKVCRNKITERAIIQFI